MRSKGNTLLICLPFTLGTALAFVTAPPPWAVQFALLLCVVCLIGLFRGGRADAPVLVLLFGGLGMFCGLVSRIDSFSAGKIELSLMPVLRERLDSLPFGNAQTADLLKALMSGDKSGLGKDAVGLFRVCGASHLLALSGLHLGIIASFVGIVLRFLGNSPASQRIRSLLLLCFCLLYCLACGASPSLVRAFIFIVFDQLGRLLPHRRMSLQVKLCWACTLQLAISPSVIGSAAFQLSYLAMAGISLFAPVFESWYPSNRLSQRFDPLRKIWLGMSVSLSCQLTTAPLVYILFGSFPQYFFLVNLIALPLCEVLIPLGIIALLPGVPAFVYSICDFLSRLLLGSLGVIAGM